MNLSRGAELFKLMTENWYQSKMRYEIERSYLWNVESFLSADVFFFLAWIQPPISVLYLAFVLFIIYIFNKEKIFGFFHVVLVISNLLLIVPIVSKVPLILVFFYFGNLSEPMPFPWCYILHVQDNELMSITRTIALYLKVLLAINRVCCIAYPFQANLWFSKSRRRSYIIATLGISGALSCFLNFAHANMSVEEYYGEMWRDGEYSSYKACSMKPSIYRDDPASMVFLTPVLNIVLNAVGFAILFVLNVWFMVHLRRASKKRKDMMGKVQNKLIKKNEKRLNRMNKIAAYILTVVVFSEIPRFINEIMALASYFNLPTYSDEASPSDQDTTRAILESVCTGIQMRRPNR